MPGKATNTDWFFFKNSTIQIHSSNTPKIIFPYFLTAGLNIKTPKLTLRILGMV